MSRTSTSSSAMSTCGWSISARSRRVRPWKYVAWLILIVWSKSKCWQWLTNRLSEKENHGTDRCSTGPQALPRHDGVLAHERVAQHGGDRPGDTGAQV